MNADKKSLGGAHAWTLLGGEERGEVEAEIALKAAQRQADAFAARILAANECPADLKEWGRAHGIPEFAEYTWQAGFLAGLRIAHLSAPAGKEGEG